MRYDWRCYKIFTGGCWTCVKGVEETLMMRMHFGRLFCMCLYRGLPLLTLL